MFLELAKGVRGGVTRVSSLLSPPFLPSLPSHFPRPIFSAPPIRLQGFSHASAPFRSVILGRYSQREAVRATAPSFPLEVGSSGHPTTHCYPVTTQLNPWATRADLPTEFNGCMYAYEGSLGPISLFSLMHRANSVVSVACCVCVLCHPSPQECFIDTPLKAQTLWQHIRAAAAAALAPTPAPAPAPIVPAATAAVAANQGPRPLPAPPAARTSSLAQQSAVSASTAVSAAAAVANGLDPNIRILVVDDVAVNIKARVRCFRRGVSVTHARLRLLRRDSARCCGRTHTHTFICTAPARIAASPAPDDISPLSLTRAHTLPPQVVVALLKRLGVAAAGTAADGAEAARMATEGDFDCILMGARDALPGAYPGIPACGREPCCVFGSS